MFEIVEVQDVDAKAWEELAKQSNVASWFQTREAYAFFDSLSFVDAFGISVNNDGILKGVVVGFVQKDGGRLKSFFSRRAIINGGPLLADDISDNELKALLNALKKKLHREAIYIESRNFNDYGQWRNVFEDCGFSYQPHYDIHVNTSSIDVVDERMGKSRKRDVRVSMRDGASVVCAPTLEQVRNYYGILEELYVTKIKTPLFPLEFFERLYDVDSSVFLLVEYDGKIVGGTVGVGLRGKALYEMYVCGKDGVFKNIFPSELATFAGIQYAVGSGFPVFDMMGAGKPDDGGYGVRDFKLKFGGELIELGRFCWVCHPMLYGIGKWAVKIMKRL